MPVQIRKERADYYRILEESQQATLDITEWLQWFLYSLYNAMKSAETTLSKVMTKHQFWAQHHKTSLNERQSKILNKLLDGFEGKLTFGKYAKIMDCSRDTALRDIKDLLQKKTLKQGDGGGRSVSYFLND